MRVGIVGAGVATKYHVSGIREVPGVEIVGICDLDEKTLNKSADFYSIKNRYTDFSKMLKEQRPEVVHVITPPSSHLALGKQAIQAGAHVMIEKPMTITVGEADEMIQTSVEKNVKLCVVHNHMYDPIFVKLKKMLKGGVIGDILYVDAKYCIDKRKMVDEKDKYQQDNWVYKLPIGIFSEYTPHIIYSMLLFLEKINAVKIMKNKLKTSAGDMINALNVQFDADNKMGNFSVMDNMEYAHFKIHIYGSKLAVHINMLNLSMTIEKNHNTLPRTAAMICSSIEEGMQILGGNISNIVKIIFGVLKRRPGHRLLIKKFYESIQNNTEVPVTGAEGREVTRIIELIQEQFKKGS